MQSSEQVEHIVQEKVRKTSNEKTLKEMQSAINEIKKEEKIDKVYALIGILLVIVCLYFLISLFL